MTQIIIVDDEVEILLPLEQMLTQEGYQVSAFSSSLAAQAHMQRHPADLAIFDIKMPEMDGFSLLKSVRAQRPNLPIIFLSSKAEEQDQIIGFTLGADDYITKPFSFPELLARIKALLRRSKPSLVSDIVEFEDLKVDRLTRRVFRKNKEIHLGPKEYDLINFFIKNPKRVYSRDQILENVWSDNINVETRTVDVHIRRLRQSINIDGFKELIRTVRSAGYSLN